MNYLGASVDKKIAMADVDDTITLMNTAFAFIDYLFRRNTETEQLFDPVIYKEKEKLEEKHRRHELTRDEVVSHFTKIYREGVNP